MCLKNIWVVIPVLSAVDQWIPVHWSGFQSISLIIQHSYIPFSIFKLPSNLNSNSTVLWKHDVPALWKQKSVALSSKGRIQSFGPFMWCDVMWCDGNHPHASSDTILVWDFVIHGLNYEIHAHSHTHTQAQRKKKVTHHGLKFYSWLSVCDLYWLSFLRPITFPFLLSQNLSWFIQFHLWRVWPHEAGCSILFTSAAQMCQFYRAVPGFQV